MRSNAQEMNVEVTPSYHYEELVRSLPENERNYIIAELESSAIVNRAELLYSQLESDTLVGSNIEESRILFLAALRNLKLGKITAAQLATLHILDSAIRTLYTNPLIYTIHKFVINKDIHETVSLFPLTDLKGMPTCVRWAKYNLLPVPKEDMHVSDLPHRMRKPLMRRYFNFSDSEWDNFCKELNKTTPSEQIFKILIAPEEGCYSAIIASVQRVLNCMHTLDWYADSNEGLMLERIVLVPSFTMFQAALNAKAITLNRNPVELIPTYGYIEANHYAKLKAFRKIAFALYMPEIDPSQRYNLYSGRFRTEIDGHPAETAFAGALHDMYHAMREMAMSENVAKARMRLAMIAKNHPNNKRTADSRPVDDILVDGELIHSYPISLDTMFDPEYRPLNAETFGDIFYVTSLRSDLHDNLKHAFIEDMVINETLWQTQFNIGKADLRKQDRDIFDEIKSQKTQASNVVRFSNARAMAQVGFLAENSTTNSKLNLKKRTRIVSEYPDDAENCMDGLNQSH